jgi:catechol 2,3-dioxygenase-like lactoylglutathione lyase family enzyme
MPTLTFNHAMIYSSAVDKALRFYQDLLGFKLLEEFKHDERCVYARLKAPRGNNTIALHLVEPGKEFHPGAIRLYFETDDLKRFCKSLEKAGAVLTQQPKKMPWGWTHAYLNDPDGHEVSIYSARQKRLKRAGKA